MARPRSFFATLKREPFYGSRRLIRLQARMAAFAWMAWCNRGRRHSALGYRSPVDYERQHATSVINLGLVV
ncbi:IS3 family transposase [Kitasatospora sp. NPDC091257]|uniref:IS3 family transposase n=1 Tax=Kitasatospora sp. NPDC091257 TaxID=3364084 RepID=UPI0037F27621